MAKIDNEIRPLREKQIEAKERGDWSEWRRLAAYIDQIERQRLSALATP